MVEHMFNSPVYKKLHYFISRKAQEILFHELQRVDSIGTDNSICGCTLRVTHSLPCACELKQFAIYMAPFMYIEICYLFIV